VVEKDLKTLGVEDWKETVQDWERWRSVVMVAKTLRDMLEKEEKEYYLSSYENKNSII
jgi:hypothetical protein